MAIATYFNPPSMSQQSYDETIRRLEQAGAGNPSGRTYHVCFGSGDKLQVFDAFDDFGKTLMPILQEIGLDPGQPYIEPVHNVIQGRG